jgi:hypothetical protein
MRQFIIHSLKIAFIALVAVAVLGASQTFAKENNQKSGLTVSPTSVDTTVPPGGSYTGKMLVINQSDLDTAYKIYATPYSVTGEEYKPYFTPIKNAIDISKWFSFKAGGSNLKVGKQDVIPFTIKVPENVGAGSYFATIFAETENKGNAGVVTRKRVGMVVYLRVSGDIIERGKVAAWNVPGIQQPPLAADVKIANSGSVHFKAKVATTVSDLFGNKKFSYAHDVQILPQKQRRIPIVWKDGATFGLFKVEGEVTYLGKTEKLPAKFVLVTSTTMMVVLIIIFLSICATLVYMGRRRVAARKK